MLVSRRAAKVLLLSVIWVLLALPRTAQAHPLGNFTINLYSHLKIQATQIELIHIVDMAEIPSYQVLAELGPTLDAQTKTAYLSQTVAQLAQGFSLQVDGVAADLRLVEQRLDLLPGQGGLQVLRVETRWSAPIVSGLRQQLSFSDSNYADRLGWREIIVTSGSGVALLSASVPQQDRSNQLRSYPDDMLSSPLDVRSAAAIWEPGTSTAPGASEVAQSANTQGNDQFAALLINADLSGWGLLLALLTAMGLGAMHALAPGHGKTIVAAYLVGTRGTFRHAIFLGLTVTITHTAGVFALGLLTLSASEFILPEQVFPWLTACSGLLVVLLGGALAWQRWHGLRGKRSPDADHSHTPGSSFGAHEHGPTTHTHMPQPAADGRLRWRSLLGLGVSGGLLPCPSALIVLLAAISLGRVGLGLVLIIAFSLGLAGVLTGIGLLMISGTRWLKHMTERPAAQSFGWGLRVMPLIAAMIVVGLGTMLTGVAYSKQVYGIEEDL